MTFDIVEVQDKFTPLPDSAFTQSFSDIDQKIFQTAKAERSSSSLMMEQSGILPSISFDASNDSIGNDTIASKTAFAAGRHSEERVDAEKGSDTLDNEKSKRRDVRELTDWPALMRLLERMRNGEALPPIKFGPPEASIRDGRRAEAPNLEQPIERRENKDEPKPGKRNLRDLTNWPELMRLIRESRNNEGTPPLKTECPPKTEPKVQDLVVWRDDKDNPGDATVLPVEPPTSNGGDYTITPVAPPIDEDGNHTIMPVEPPDDDAGDGKPEPVKEIPLPGLGREFSKEPEFGTPEHRQWLKQKMKEQIGRGRSFERGERQWSI